MIYVRPGFVRNSGYGLNISRDCGFVKSPLNETLHDVYEDCILPLILFRKGIVRKQARVSFQFLVLDRAILPAITKFPLQPVVV